VKVTLRTKSSTIPVVLGDATVLLGDRADATNGLCAETDFFDAGDCRFNGTRTTLSCAK